MTDPNFRKTEIEQHILQHRGKPRSFFSKALLAEAIREGAINPDDASNVDTNATYCPTCDILSSEQTGCPTHGVWW